MTANPTRTPALLPEAKDIAPAPLTAAEPVLNPYARYAQEAESAARVHDDLAARLRAEADHFRTLSASFEADVTTYRNGSTS